MYRTGDDTPGSPEIPQFERFSDETGAPSPSVSPRGWNSSAHRAPLRRQRVGSEVARTVNVHLRQTSISGPVSSDRAVLLKVPANGSKAAWSQLSGGNARPKV